MSWKLKQVSHPQEVGYGNLRAGDWWYCRWYWDPKDPDTHRERGGSFLSDFYWREWADKRPPICIRLPGGHDWCPDKRASNGPGWAIIGPEGFWTATPSILVPNYHGFLKMGILTTDIEGRAYP